MVFILNNANYQCVFPLECTQINELLKSLYPCQWSRFFFLGVFLWPCAISTLLDSLLKTNRDRRGSKTLCPNLE